MFSVSDCSDSLESENHFVEQAVVSVQRTPHVAEADPQCPNVTFSHVDRAKPTHLVGHCRSLPSTARVLHRHKDCDFMQSTNYGPKGSKTPCPKGIDHENADK